MICTEFTTQPLPTNWKFQNLTGQVFYYLTVVSYAGKQGVFSRWNCICDCGNKTVVRSDALKTGHIKSCGCKQRELIGHSRRTHGETGKTPEYAAYKNAKARCQNPKDISYKHYGKRGIEFRFTSYTQFLDHIGRMPTAEHTLDRKDVNGHYEIGNVKWSTATEQARNKRNNTIIVIDDIGRCVAEWAEKLQVNPNMILMRMGRGWCGPCSVTIPKRKGTCPHNETHIGIKLLEKNK